MNRRTAVLVFALAVAPFGSAQTLALVGEGDCGDVILHATRTASFPALGEPIPAAQVRSAYVVFEKKRLQPQPSSSAHSLDYPATVTADDRNVMASVALRPVDKGNETWTEGAKTMVFCGKTTPQSDYQRLSGLPFEIVPQGWNGPRPTTNGLRTTDY